MAIKMFLKNTIQKEWRSRTLLFLLIVTVVLVILASMGLAYFKNEVLNSSPLEGLAKSTLGFFFWGMNIWSYLIATFIGVSCVRSDLETGTISQMLTFPVTRMEYFLGRLFGSYVIVTGYYFLSMGICVAGVSLAIGEFIFGPELFLGILITSLSNLVVIALAMFIGFYMGTLQTFILNFILTFIVGFSNSFFIERGFVEGLKEPTFLKALAALFHVFLPHFSHWENWGKSFILGNEYKFDAVMEVPHFIVTCLLLGTIILWRFKRKEI